MASAHITFENHVHVTTTHTTRRLVKYYIHTHSSAPQIRTHANAHFRHILYLYCVLLLLLLLRIKHMIACARCHCQRNKLPNHDDTHAHTHSLAPEYLQRCVYWPSEQIESPAAAVV